MVLDEKKAFLVIDMLNDFVSENGALLVPNAKEIVPNIKRELEKARRDRIPIIYINDSHDEHDSEFQYWPRHAVEGSWGSRVIDELAPQEKDYVITKRRYSGFFATGLDLLLREMKTETLIITGTVTNICVYFTAADAYMRGYKIIVPRDCVIGLNKAEHDFALKQLQQLFGAQII
jgi:nicotinamidase-related amidase